MTEGKDSQIKGNFSILFEEHPISKKPKILSIPIWEKIKQKVKIPDLIKLENERYECLKHGNIKSPSCQYNSDDTLYCHKCQRTMDVIEVYSILNNLTRSESIKGMCKKYNIEFGTYDEIYYKTYEKIKELHRDFMEICHNNPIFKQNYENDLINRRGFTLKTIELFKIGLFDDVIRDSMEKKYSKKLLRDAGLISKKGYWIIGKRIVYSYLNQNKEPTYFIFRTIDSEPDFHQNAKYIKLRRTNFVEEIPFGLNSISDLKSNILIITEGITDAISVIQSNFPCLSPVTTRIKKNDIEKMITYCKRFEKIIVINDNEENQSGLERSKRYS